MKIKEDFVTNSSSCSYIVCIPDMESFLEELESVTDVPLQISDCFRRGNEYIWFGSDLYDDFYKIHDAVEQLGYVIGFDEHGPENEPQYINIASNENTVKKLVKILNTPKKQKPKLKKGEAITFLGHKLVIISIKRDSSNPSKIAYKLSCAPNCCQINPFEMDIPENDLIQLLKGKTK